MWHIYQKILELKKILKKRWDILSNGGILLQKFWDMTQIIEDSLKKIEKFWKNFRKNNFFIKNLLEKFITNFVYFRKTLRVFSKSGKFL